MCVRGSPFYSYFYVRLDIWTLDKMPVFSSLVQLLHLTEHLEDYKLIYSLNVKDTSLSQNKRHFSYLFRYLKTGSRGEHLNPKRDENGEWRRLHNEELHSLYCSANIVRVIKSNRLWWAGHVARTAEGRRAFKILTG